MIKKIQVYKNSRNMNLGTTNSFGLGVENDNLVDTLYFEFDEMVESQATLLTSLKDDNEEPIAFPLTKEENGYSLEVTNSMLLEPTFEIQLMVVDGEEVWHSNKYEVRVNPCLEGGEGEMPTALEIWITELENKIDQADSINIEAEKVGTTTTITITDKEGQTSSVEILDGETGPRGENGVDGQDGQDGQDATINGVSTLTIEAGDNITIDQEGTTMTISSSGGSGGTSDYSDLENKPKINNVELSGNKSLNDLGIQPSGDYLTSSDLTDYVKNTDYSNGQKGGVIKVGSSYGTTMSSSGYLTTVTKTYEDYNSLGNGALVGKGTLENVITGKGLVSNTNYATTNKGGVVRVNDDFGVGMVTSGGGSGMITSTTKTYANYQSGDNRLFISKGTLENVLNGKGFAIIPTLTGTTQNPIQLVNLDEGYYLLNDYYTDGEQIYGYEGSKLYVEVSIYTEGEYQDKNIESLLGLWTFYKENAQSNWELDYHDTFANNNDVAMQLSSKSPKLAILSYGSSTWNDFLTAYQNNAIVYCRASSNSNPATGSQTRMAFMAYVSNETNPTSVEFQYYRSVNTHSASQQGDQVFVYKLTNANGGTWSVETREASTKIVVGNGLTSSYSNGVLTISLSNQ